MMPENLIPGDDIEAQEKAIAVYVQDQMASGDMRMDLAFAIIIVLALLGLMLFYSVMFLF